jgi:hypothetical protein
MNMSFQAVALSGDLVPQALPLIRATWPSADLPSWRKFVEAFAGHAATQESGVLGLRDQSGCLCGVCAYRLDWGLLEGPVLGARLFTAADVANSKRTVQALLEAAERRAVDLGCAGIQIWLTSGQAALAKRVSPRISAAGLTARLSSIGNGYVINSSATHLCRVWGKS